MLLFESVHIILFTSVLCTVVTGDMFTGTSSLRALSDAEETLLDDLLTVYQAQKTKIDKLRGVIDSIKHTQSLDVTSVVSNPIHTYNLVKHWTQLREIFVDNNSTDDTPKKPPMTVGSCFDESESCDGWAARGECTSVKYKAFMATKCKLACNLCESRDYSGLLLENQLRTLHSLIRTSPPTETDFAGAAEGLLRLQRTYRLSTRKLLAGKVYGIDSAKPLSATDAFYIGRAAVNMLEWGYAAQWLKIAWKLHSNSIYTGPIAFKLAKAYIQMKDYVRAHEFLREALSEYFEDPAREPICADEEEQCGRYVREGICKLNTKVMRKNCRYSCMLCQRNRPEHYQDEYKIMNLYHLMKKRVDHMKGLEPLPEPNYIRHRSEPIVDTYEKLCRGRAIKWYKKAGCKFRSAILPWNVYKEEVLHLNPRVALIYDVITDKEADIIRRLAKNKMQRAFVGGDRQISRNRVSDVGWLPDESPFMAVLSKRVAVITGLETVLKNKIKGRHYISADEFQAVNYGIGGHYEPHHDFFHNVDQIKTDVGDTIRNSGDRIATFLLYLTDVKAGGGTVYPKIKIQVPPTKNAAAFWYNAKLSGEYDELTMHAGCPVLLGEKWVCNKWIREYGNHFKRRCPQQEDAVYTIEDVG